ncbi:MAG: glutathione S-transferase family protein [Pseudomonadota bacterium]
MTDITLYVAPYACPRVPTIALEEAGVEFETKVVAFKAGEHKKPDYLAINPKGKVPALVVDGEPLTENVAILTWIADAFPEAKLMPATSTPIEKLRQTADLAFCAGGLHPIVSRIRMPMMFAEGGEAIGAVKAKAMADMAGNAAMIDTRLAGGWWYGDEWSVVDGYLFWIWFRITGAGFPEAEYPNWAAHYARSLERPAVQRMLAREEGWQADLEARGLALPANPPKAGAAA